MMAAYHAFIPSQQTIPYLDPVLSRIYNVPNQAFTPGPSILFVNRFTGSLGISLGEALGRRYSQLLNPEDLVFDDLSRVKVTLHIQWGEYPIYSRAKNITTHKKGRVSSITREKTAHEVAKLVKGFIDQFANREVLNPWWKVGPGFIDLQDIYLLELRHVSVGSYQAILAVGRNPSTM